MNIQGQWTSIINYGKEHQNFKGKSLYFDIEIIQENDRFTGNAIDVGGVGMSPDPATINGKIEGIKIEFSKQYSSYHYYVKGKTTIDKSRKGPLIHYTGQYDVKDQSFIGNWIIKGKIKLLGIIPINFSNAGNWVMRRK